MCSLHNITSPTPSTWRLISQFSLPNQRGAEFLLQAPVATALKPYFLSAAELARLMNALVETVVDLLGHQPELSLFIQLLVADQVVKSVPETTWTIAEGVPKERRYCWGFFLVARGANHDDHPAVESSLQIIELFLYPEGEF